MERIARSMNEQLIEGATDTSVGKRNGPDRLNSSETMSPAERALNRGGYYGSKNYVDPYDVIAGVVRGT